MARTWLITSRGVAKKIRNANCSVRQISELSAEACKECPNCKHIIDNNDTVMWPGLPAGVKFDPSDSELLEHLEHKIGVGGSKPHIFIDEFIPTVENDEGICYSHPENLPGTKKDGSSAHFFHRVSNAYGCGQRKRRRISHIDQTTSDEHVRWHKTGKSKQIYDNGGVMKGWKKILVLYKNPQRGSRPDKANWVMHEYHLGVEEKEEVGEFVVSKILYQVKTKQVDKSETEMGDEESDAFAARVCPKTPKTKTPKPCRPNNSPLETEQNDPILQDQEEEEEEEEEADKPAVSLADAKEPDWFNLSPLAVTSAPLAATSAPLAGTNLDDTLRCHEDFSSFGQSGALDRPIFSQGNETLDGLPYVHGTLPEDLLLYSPQFFGSWQWSEAQD
uniref:Uncharacterized protein n=1 Tax=Avena sativa TaxID=4498 RepID=A0ACD5YTZ7_AVESA